MSEQPSFQARVHPWMMECFGPEISADRLERNDRFIEEALELVQASDYPPSRAHELVDYVYGRDQGEINQEVGGVMVTLAAHCLAHGVDMHEAGETELARIWTKVPQIRAKQAAKPKGGALPVDASFHVPPVSLLCKLASIAVHADEWTSTGAHTVDREAIRSLLADPDVKVWLEKMTAAALAPRKRQP